MIERERKREIEREKERKREREKEKKRVCFFSKKMISSYLISLTDVHKYI